MVEGWKARKLESWEAMRLEGIFSPLPSFPVFRELRRVGCAHHLFHHITRTFRKLFKEFFSFDM
jgi:hypothetical protein